MPRNSFDLPAPSFVHTTGAGNRIVQWNGLTFPLGAAFRTTDAAYLRYVELFSIDSAAASNQRLSLQTAPTARGVPVSPGPDFPAAFEAGWTIRLGAYRFDAADFDPDDSEPYTWRGNAAGFGTQAARDAFRAAMHVLGGAQSTALVLEFGAAPRTAGLGLGAGRPDEHLPAVPAPAGLGLCAGRPTGIGQALARGAGAGMVARRAPRPAIVQPAATGLAARRPALPAKARAATAGLAAGRPGPPPGARIRFPSAEPLSFLEPPPAPAGAGARFRQAVRALAAERALLAAVTIDHPDAPEPARLVDSPRDAVLGGRLFLASSFGYRLSTDEADRSPSAQLVVPFAGRRMAALLEATGGGVGASVDLSEWSVDPLQPDRAADPEWRVRLYVVKSNIAHIREAKLPSGQRPQVLALYLGVTPRGDRPGVSARYTPASDPWAFA